MKFVEICLVTNNVPEMVDFYTKVLGVKAEGDDVHTVLDTDGAGIAIFSTEGMESMAPHSVQGAGCGSFTGKSQKAPSLAVGVNCKAEDLGAAQPPRERSSHWLLPLGSPGAKRRGASPLCLRWKTSMRNTNGSKRWMLSSSCCRRRIPGGLGPFGSGTPMAISSISLPIWQSDYHPHHL